MRVHTTYTNVYTFDELDASAKQNAIYNIYLSIWDVYAEEIWNSIQVIANELNITVNCDSYDRFYFRNNNNFDADNMNFTRAIAWINNNVEIMKLSYSKRKKHIGKVFPKKEYYFDCNFTGVCCDYIFYDAYIKFIEYGRKYGNETTLEKFFDCVVSCATKEVEAEKDNINTEEYASEYADANNLEFKENGDIF